MKTFMKNSHRKIIIGIILILLFSLTISSRNIKAAYIYGPDQEKVSSAEAMVVVNTIDNSNLVDTNGNLVPSSTYNFSEIFDIACHNNYIYISDSKNNKVVILNNKFQYVDHFPKEDSDYTLVQPKGLYINDEYIYVCDYGQNRIVLINHDLQLESVVSTPDDAAFAGYEFRPKRITVTRTKRMYVIAEGINEGIIDFNSDGTFSRYYGMNSVSISAWNAFWLLFTSEEQRKSQGYNFGTSLTSLCIDKDEYIYTVSSVSNDGKVIKKLNYKGSDILVRNGYTFPAGDIVGTTSSQTKVPDGQSILCDIDVNDYGTYIVLDKTRGRIFAYDFEGNMLYNAGQLSNATGGVTQTQSSMFQNPESLCYFEDKVLVVDSKNKNLIVFEFTTFGKLVNQATHLYYNNEFMEASSVWEQVLELNTNYYLAYSGIGKAQLREGNYKDAMENLKLGNDKYSYSRAYQQYRYEKLSKIFPVIIGVVMVGCITLFIFLFRNSMKTTEKEDKERG